jgi:hypothetical protein
MEHEYREKLVIAAKKAFEDLWLWVDDPMQALLFDHDNQDSFLDT